MDLHEIEALAFAELKEARATITETLRALNPAVLAPRLVHYMQDAKQRDEKLAEQGKTITTLQRALAAAEQQEQRRVSEVAGYQQELRRLTHDKDAYERQAEKALATVRADAEAQASESAKQSADLAAQLEAAERSVTRLRMLATRNNTAISQAAKILTDALSTNVVEDAANVTE